MEVDWLILADSAQVTGGKLYMLGGGWDRLTVPVRAWTPSTPHDVSSAPSPTREVSR